MATHSSILAWDNPMDKRVHFKDIIKNTQEYFPGGPVVKNPPANAGDMGSVSGPERFHMLQSNQAHMPQLLSRHTLGPTFHNKRNCHSEKTIHHN